MGGRLVRVLGRNQGLFVKKGIILKILLFKS